MRRLIKWANGDMNANDVGVWKPKTHDIQWKQNGGIHKILSLEVIKKHETKHFQSLGFHINCVFVFIYVDHRNVFQLINPDVRWTSERLSLSSHIHALRICN